ncbi:MAG: hypothetical protein Q9183_007904, partial [Haloplaca sp. 2 TL-2023]
MGSHFSRPSSIRHPIFSDNTSTPTHRPGPRDQQIRHEAKVAWKEEQKNKKAAKKEGERSKKEVAKAKKEEQRVKEEELMSGGMTVGA